MDYELAKKLKDAGFPQNDNCLQWFDKTYDFDLNDYNGCGMEGEQDEFKKDEDVALPTLSELIEACYKEGIYFELQGYNNEWLAFDGTQLTKEFNKKGEGKTPEEAVANLWLALNKKV